ncbi:MAG: FG-GAP repeat domain-containing protein [Bryobacteraceae bacterium]
MGNAIENFDGLRWYRNLGKWKLARQPNVNLNLPWNHYHQLEPVDWNGDGKPDLLAASEGGWVYYYEHK